MSNGRIQYERIAAGKLILNTFVRKLLIVITEKRLKCFFLKETEEDKLEDKPLDWTARSLYSVLPNPYARLPQWQ